MKDLIKKIVAINGPSGFEHSVREFITEEIKTYANEIKVDALGNLIARVGEPGVGKKIMISAHMDEIGVIVTHVDRKGFARFTNLGGVSAKNCVGARVAFLDGVNGVIHHDFPAEQAPLFSDLFIDVGATSAGNCPVKVGDIAAFERPFVDLGDRMVSKAMDDRIGCVVAIETMKAVAKANPANEIYFVFSVQEEVGLRGATTSAFGVNPEIGIAIDVTATGDTPNGMKLNMALGKGPAIKVRDSGMISDPRIVDWMVKTAEVSKIPYQLEVLTFGTTDARAIQVARAGVPVGCLSIPTRYLHTPSEMVDFGDIQNSIRLLTDMLKQSVVLE